jgi:hypothetical protein
MRISSVPKPLLQNSHKFIWKSLEKDIWKEFIEPITGLGEFIRGKYTKLAKSKSFAQN